VKQKTNHYEKKTKTIRMHQWQQINKKTVAEKINWTWLPINTVVSVTETITFRSEGQH